MRHSTDERCGGVSSLCEIEQAQTRKHEHRRRSDFAQSAYDSWFFREDSRGESQIGVQDRGEFDTAADRSWSDQSTN